MKKWAKSIPFFILFAVAGVFAIGALVMVLWNAIIPAVFHAGTITLLQAVGMIVLTRLLFGFRRGWGGRHRHHHHGGACKGGRGYMSARWEGANREEHATESSNANQYTASWQVRYNPESAL